MKKKRILILFILMGSIFLLGACTREKKMKLEQYAVFNSESQTYEWILLGCGNYTPNAFGMSIQLSIKVLLRAVSI